MTGHCPRAILFDLDGTLVDTIALIVASFRHAFSSVVGEVPDEALIRSWIGRPLLATMRDAAGDAGAELESVYLAWNLAHTPDLLREVPGMVGVLQGLRERGVPIGVVTSKRRESARWALELAGLDQLIDVCVGLGESPRHKPAPDPLLAGAALLGVDPVDCAYVGDAVVDIEAARAAGMQAVAVTWGAGRSAALVAAEPDALVTDAGQLAAVLTCGGVAGVAM